MTSDVFWVFFDLPTYPNQMVYYISLFSKIRCTLTYLPTQKSDVIYECSLWCDLIQFLNMSRLVKILWYNLIRFYKHVQTCHDTIISLMFLNLSELVLNYNMTKFSEIWVNGTRNADDKAIPWTTSTSEWSKIQGFNQVQTF